MHGYATRDAVALLKGRDEVAEILTLNKYIDLVIPRGSNELVKTVSVNAPNLLQGNSVCRSNNKARAYPYLVMLTASVMCTSTRMLMKRKPCALVSKEALEQEHTLDCSA